MSIVSMLIGIEQWVLVHDLPCTWFMSHRWMWHWWQSVCWFGQWSWTGFAWICSTSLALVTHVCHLTATPCRFVWWSPPFPMHPGFMLFLYLNKINDSLFQVLWYRNHGSSCPLCPSTFILVSPPISYVKAVHSCVLDLTCHPSALKIVVKIVVLSILPSS